MREATLLLALVLVTTPLVGCIGDEAVEPQTTPTPSDVTELPPTAAILHQATADGAVAPVNGTLSDVLGVEVPVPVGVERLNGHEAFEPTLGVTSDGTLFMSNTGGSPGSFSSIVRSTDGGLTWEDVTPTIAGTITGPPTTFDPYVHVDQATDRVYNLDMEGLNCNWIKWSDDNGETWTHNPAGCGLPPVLDHPSLFTGSPRTLTTVGYENLVYLCVNRVADAACATSLDGGMTFTPFKTVFPEPDADAESCGGLHGHGTTGPDGRAYLGKMHCGVPTVAVSEDDGLTWSTTVVSQEHTSTRHDVEVAVDSAGNVYAFWVTEAFDPYLSVSTDHGGSWSQPVMVGHPDVGTAVFPSITAGDEGRIAFVYIGTDSDEEIADMDEEVTWNAYLGTVVNATAPEPVVTTSPVNPPDEPIARGPCDDDNRCDGIGDFIDIVIDDDGRPWAALVDVCHEACDAEDGNDEAIGAVATLTQGFTLRGELAPLPAFASTEQTTEETPSRTIDQLQATGPAAGLDQG